MKPRGSMDGQPVASKDPIGYDAVDFPARDAPPKTQAGNTPDLPTADGTQNDRLSADPVLFAKMPPDGPWNTEPRDDMSIPTTNVGAGSLGPVQDGWHPAKEGG